MESCELVSSAKEILLLVKKLLLTTSSRDMGMYRAIKCCNILINVHIQIYNKAVTSHVDDYCMCQGCGVGTQKL
jgi:hypothetical protein